MGSDPDPEPPILRLPLEIVVPIMRMLDDVDSLANASLSHRLFYNAINFGQLIVWDVLQNHLADPRLLPYALACASRIEDPVQLLKTYSPGEPVNLDWCGPSMSISDAHRIASLHHLVLRYTQAYFDTALAEVASLLKHVDGAERLRLPQRPSSEELFRVRRALYRFELYGRLVPSMSILSRVHRDVASLFFDPYTLWANEQLAAIREFLEARLSISFDDVAAHDVFWGQGRVPWITRPVEDNPLKEHMLTLGLRCLSRLETLTTYADKRSYLTSRLGVSPAPLAAAIRNAAMRQPGIQTVDLLPMGEMGQSDNEDQDEMGPAMWWYAASTVAPRPSPLAVSPTIKLFRKCGHVIWDGPELPVTDTALPALQIYSMFLSASVSAAEHDAIQAALSKAWEVISRGEDPSTEAWDSMLESFQIRKQIWKDGGSGYWSKDDLSQIVWTTMSKKRSEGKSDTD